MKKEETKSSKGRTKADKNSSNLLSDNSQSFTGEKSADD